LRSLGKQVQYLAADNTTRLHPAGNRSVYSAMANETFLVIAQLVAVLATVVYGLLLVLLQVLA